MTRVNNVIEKGLMRNAINYLKDNEVISFIITSTDNNAPDIVALFNNGFNAYIKFESHLSKDQINSANKITHKGYFYYTINSMDNLKELVDMLLIVTSRGEIAACHKKYAHKIMSDRLNEEYCDID